MTLAEAGQSARPRALAWVARTLRDRFLKLSRHDPAWAVGQAAALPVPQDWPLEALCRTDAEGRTTHLIGLINDITRTREAEQQMLRQAHYDALTELPNRHLMLEHLGAAIANARRLGQSVALLLMDLNQRMPM